MTFTVYTLSIDRLPSIEENFWRRCARELRHTCARSADELADFLDEGKYDKDWEWADGYASASFTVHPDVTTAMFVTTSSHGLRITLWGSGVVEIVSDDYPSETFWGDSGEDFCPAGEEAEKIAAMQSDREARFFAGLVRTDEEVRAHDEAAKAVWDAEFEARMKERAAKMAESRQKEREATQRRKAAAKAAAEAIRKKAKEAALAALS